MKTRQHFEQNACTPLHPYNLTTQNTNIINSITRGLYFAESKVQMGKNNNKNTHNATTKSYITGAEC